MFDWLYSSAMLGVLIALFSIAIALSEFIRQRRKTRTMRISECIMDSTLPELVASEEPEKPDKKRRKTNVHQLMLIKETVDVITYRLSLIESSIYQDVNPRPHLTPEEYTAATKQIKSLVRIFKRMPELAFAMTEAMSNGHEVEQFDRT